MCKDVAAGKPILYISGSSNFAPLLQELAEIIVNESGIMPVFRTTTSCTGVKSMNPTSPTYSADHFIKDPTTAANEPYPTYAQAYLGDGNPSVPCLLGTATPVDIGESEIAPGHLWYRPTHPTRWARAWGRFCRSSSSCPSSRRRRRSRRRQPGRSSGAAAAWPTGVAAAWHHGSIRSYLFIRGQGTATLRLVANQIGLPLEPVLGN